MLHYICTGGCMLESDAARSCYSESCEHFGKPLEECECEDGRHPAQLLKKEKEEGEEIL